MNQKLKYLIICFYTYISLCVYNTIKFKQNLSIHDLMFYRLLGKIEAPDTAMAGAWMPSKPFTGVSVLAPGSSLYYSYFYSCAARFDGELHKWTTVTNLSLTLKLRIGRGLNYWGQGSLISAKACLNWRTFFFFPALHYKDN